MRLVWVHVDDAMCNARVDGDGIDGYGKENAISLGKQGRCMNTNEA